MRFLMPILSVVLLSACSHRSPARDPQAVLVEEKSVRQMAFEGQQQNLQTMVSQLRATGVTRFIAGKRAVWPSEDILSKCSFLQVRENRGDFKRDEIYRVVEKKTDDPESRRDYDVISLTKYDPSRGASLLRGVANVLDEAPTVRGAGQSAEATGRTISYYRYSGKTVRTFWERTDKGTSAVPNAKPLKTLLDSECR